MRKLGAYFAVAAFIFISSASLPAPAFGFRIGPFHLGLPFFGHGHHYHRPLYMHGNPNEVTRHEPPQSNTQHQLTLAFLYPSRALPAIFQNIFWPAFSSAWPFGYEAIFATAFAQPPVDRGAGQCRQSVDANALMARVRAELEPNADQMERLQRLVGAIGAATDYLAKSCPTDIPDQPTARLRLMDSQIQGLTMAIDVIHQPLRDFEQSLTPEQQARFSGGGAMRSTADSSGKTDLRSCGVSSAAIEWPIDQIDKSVQPTAQQRTALGDVQQTFGNAASDLKTHCPASVPQSAVARLETIEARLDATWRAILSIQVALEDFESKLSDDQKYRLRTMTVAAQ